MPIMGPADDASRDDSQDGPPRDTPGDSRRGELRRSVAGPETSLDGPPAEPGRLGMQTAPGWLPAHLLAVLNHDAPADSDDTVAEAFCQGSPLDELPPGPTLTAFLIKASAPQHPADASAGASAGASATGVPGAVPPSQTRSPGAVPPPRTEDPNTVPPHRTEDHGAGRRAGPGTRSGATEDPGASPLSPHRGHGRFRGHRIVRWTEHGAGACRRQRIARAYPGLAEGRIHGGGTAELAAVAEFSGRRQAEAKSAGEWDSKAVNAADHEIAAALTLTSRSAGVLIDRAMALRELPATAAALAAGQIDMAKALVFMTGLDGRDPTLARTIEDGLIGRAPAQTTGQLRAALHRALLAADPDAAERRRQAEEKQARVEQMPESGGVTASLAGQAPTGARDRCGLEPHHGARGPAPPVRCVRHPGWLGVPFYLALLSGQAAGGLPRGDAKGFPGTKTAQYGEFPGHGSGRGPGFMQAPGRTPPERGETRRGKKRRPRPRRNAGPGPRRNAGRGSDR